MRADKRIGEILVDLQVLGALDVDRVLTALRRRRDHTKFGEMARYLGLLEEEHILAALAVQQRLLPGIHQLSIGRILDVLKQPSPPVPPKKTAGPLPYNGISGGIV